MYVIMVYDVSQKRCAKVLKIGRKYLTWIQNSVFEGEITDLKLRLLKQEIKSKIDENEDFVLWYVFRSAKNFKRDHLGVMPNEKFFIIE